MNAAHTPGPWIVAEDFGVHVIRGASTSYIEDGCAYESRDYVASTWGGPHEANSRLIAAAPELLEALQDLVDFCAEQNPMQGDIERDDLRVRSAFAAIAKATGSAS